jgi:DNA sulfur modification protein DndD
MIIHSIELTNFRQFRGTQIIRFSTDEIKKTTIVLADNTTGKTTLLESFSWVFYGKTLLTSIWNTGQLKDMVQNSQLEMKGIVVLEHNGVVYTIKRTHYAIKSNITVAKDKNEIFIIEYKVNGISKQAISSEAEKIINQIVPYELFPYFFFKGEKIEKIGNEISKTKGKTGESNEFVTAVRGMLGFDFLYTTIKHLEILAKSYRSETMKSSDLILSGLVRKIEKLKTDIADADTKADLAKSESEYYHRERDILIAEIQMLGDVTDKQIEAQQLEKLLGVKHQSINDQKRKIFGNFSSNSFKYLTTSLLKDAKKYLLLSESLEKGIPGLQSDAVEYIIKQGKCICGADLTADEIKVEHLVELIKYLPPHNIGHEISSFSSLAEDYQMYGIRYLESFLQDRKNLDEAINYYNEKQTHYDQLTEEIKSYPNIADKKILEQEYKKKMFEKAQDEISIRNSIEVLNSELQSAIKEKSNYSIQDENNRKIAKYEAYCNNLIQMIDKFCRTQENIKKLELQNAINIIFTTIFNAPISIVLNEDYSISFNSLDAENSDDIENSTSQNGIMAFSFIGGIIQLARKMVHVKNEDDTLELEEEMKNDPYPLVMDAPSSSFDTKRIRSFSTILPQIAEQVIIFIKDTDGNYAKEYLRDSIGREYQLLKENMYSTVIKEVR